MSVHVGHLAYVYAPASLIYHCSVKVLYLFHRSFKIARVWMPVNVIFVGMIWTSFFALKNLGVPMATVLKNLTNLFTIGGDYLLYGKVGQPSYGQGAMLLPVYLCDNAENGGGYTLCLQCQGWRQPGKSPSQVVTVCSVLAWRGKWQQCGT